jgi:lysophospholipid acyltransferase (LPLAT)-like uncharacterized protein
VSLKKRILRSRAARAAACWTMAQYIRLVWSTGRWRVVGLQQPTEFWDRDEAFVTVLWHARMLMIPLVWRRGVEVRMLISQHLDGELIARTIARLGVGAVRGSSSRREKGKDKGGAAALRAMVRLLKDGCCIGVTPDGPRGPRMRAGDGVVALARLSGAAVLPVAYSASPRPLLSTWDRFLVPLPFSRGVIVWGEPLRVSRGANEEEARREIEDALNRTTAEADRLAGKPPVEPA